MKIALKTTSDAQSKCLEGYYGDEAVGRGPTNRRKVVLIGVVDHAWSKERFKTPLV